MQNWACSNLTVLDFWYFSVLTPKTQNSDFSKINAYKGQHFGVIQKTGIHVVKLHTSNTHTKFQNNIFIFGCAMVKNQVNVMTSLFWNVIFFWPFHLPYVKINSMFGILRQNWTRKACFQKKILIWKIWPFWPSLTLNWLSSGQT